MADPGQEDYAAQIATELHPHIEFLKDRWQEFCAMVEKNAEKLAYYQKEYYAEKYQLMERMEKTKLAWFYDRKINERLLQKCFADLNQIQLKMDEENKELQNQGWATWNILSWKTEYLDLPELYGDFCAPPDVVNPVLWILDNWNPRESTPEESLLCDYAILCYVHDHNISSGELRIYSPRNYKGKYFACDKFYLDRHVWPIDRLKRAFDAVKAALDKQEQNEQYGKAGQDKGYIKKNIQQFGFSKKLKWEFHFSDKKAIVDASLKGLTLIEYLLLHKDTEYKPLELLKAVGQREESETESEKIYSPKDIEQIKKAIEGLEGRVKSSVDQHEKERFEREIEESKRELEKASNYKGNSRKFSEKYTKSVSRNIDTVLNKIAPQHQELYNHLNTFLKRGEICSYKPDSEISWEIT